jgi:hypothetical protein
LAMVELRGLRLARDVTRKFGKPSKNLRRPFNVPAPLLTADGSQRISCS